MKQDEVKKDEIKPEVQDPKNPEDALLDEYKEDLEDYLEEQGVYIRQ